MDSITAEHAQKAIDLLQNNVIEREAALQQYPATKTKEDSDEECDSESPIYDSFYFQNGSETILLMTNLSSKEFSILWNSISNLVVEKWNVGRGRRYAYTGKDVFFMTLTTLKHGGTWAFLGQIFNINGATFERMILKFITSIALEFYNHYVDDTDGLWTMKKILRHNLSFKTYKYCRYATDVYFQESFRPSGSIVEGKKYYSGKHKLYGFKVEVSVLSNGIAINCSEHAPGATADIDIFYQNLEMHKKALKKRDNEGMKYVLDSGELLDSYSEYWGVLMDKGYQGANEHVRAVHPKKKPPRGCLSIADQRRNQKISADRVIVENYFGRMSKLWNIISAKFKWSEKYYDEIFYFCVCLTNAHITWHPLRAEDGHFYNQIRNRLFAKGEKIVQKRRLAQQKYEAKRQRRMKSKFRDIGSDEDTVDPNNIG